MNNRGRLLVAALLISFGLIGCTRRDDSIIISESQDEMTVPIDSNVTVDMDSNSNNSKDRMEEVQVIRPKTQLVQPTPSSSSSIDQSIPTTQLSPESISNQEVEQVVPLSVQSTKSVQSANSQIEPSQHHHPVTSVSIVVPSDSTSVNDEVLDVVEPQ
ncbi:MAG: hypothetical protein LBL40_01010 [Coxiellaceae bacterium]|jgi:hypothetical protein|nr:hypothetical protein [Coxiellaceae bacterium]